MAKVLTERVTWRRERDPNTTRRASDLTPDEQAHVRAALAFLRVRMGGWSKLAAAMRVNFGTLKMAPRRTVTGGLAIRVARVAGVPIDDVLSGAWPPAGVCPHCGHVASKEK